MSNPFVGEIRMFAGNFPPAGWAFCDGSLLSIAENEVLFVLIGTTYGGDGQTTFAVPDMRGRVPVHQGAGPGLSPRTLGELMGTETVTLTPAQMPQHNHGLNASTSAASAAGTPSGLVATTTATRLYGATPGGAEMAPQVLPSVGGSQPHNNLAPYQCVNFIISLFGIFPQQA